MRPAAVTPLRAIAHAARIAARIAPMIAASLAASAAALARPAHAQLPSHASAACVGGALGCTQVDFALTLDAGAPASLDFFRLRLFGDGWAFAAGQAGEAEDALGPTFFAPAVSPSGLALEGTFDPGFEPLLDPTLRVRAEMDAAPGADASSLQFLYLAGTDGRPTIAGMRAGFGAALSVACVGGAIGCAEADFTFTLRGLTSVADYFRLWLPDGGPWRFLDGQAGEAEDALGLNFFAPEVTDGGLTLGGTFAPGFEAALEPTLRIRAQLDPGAAPAALAPPAVVFELGYLDRPRFAGVSGVAVSAVPEPSTLALLGAGLLLLPLARAARARRTPA